jgi:hypothetical protein
VAYLGAGGVYLGFSGPRLLPPPPLLFFYPSFRPFPLFRVSPLVPRDRFVSQSPDIWVMHG